MDKSTIFLQLLEKSSLTIVLFIIITKIKGFKYIFQKENYKLKDLLVISLIFTLLILGTKVLGKCNGFEKCICKTGGCLLASIIGTLIAGIAILIVEISTGSIVSILSVGFAAFFFVWMILSTVSLIGCLIRDICNR